MNYDWDINKLIKHKKFLKKLLKAKNENYNLDSIKAEINSLDDMIALMGHSSLKNLFNIFITSKYVDAAKYFPEYSYYSFLNIPDDIKKVILDSKDIWFSTDDTYDDSELASMNISDDDLIKMTYNFLNNIPTKDRFYAEYFDRIVNSNEKLLKLTPEQDYFVSGCTFVINHPEYLPYIIVHRNYDVSDFLTLCHEFAHAIFFRNNPYSNYFISELEGFYFEMLAIEYLNDKVDNHTINDLKYSMFNTEYINFFNLYLTSLTSKQINKTKNINLFDIVKAGNEDGCIIDTNEEQLVYALADNSFYNTKYIFSYLVFLDLYEHHKNNPENAFHIFEKIRLSRDDNIFDNLRDNKVSFFDDGYKNLQKTIDNINKY